MTDEATPAPDQAPTPTGPGTPAEAPPPTPEAVAGPLEALLLMATEPISTAELAQALDVPKPVVWDALDQLRTFYDETGRGFELREVGGGWRLYVREEHDDLVSEFVNSQAPSRLSQAALETLAVIAYRQPVSRARISAVRGVNVDGVLRTLQSRGLIEEAGTDPSSQAILFRTTPYFLERMGIASLDDLPDLAEHLPDLAELEAVIDAVAAGE